MKTQLLEDFDESGSAPVNRPAAPRPEPGPAPGPVPEPRTAPNPQPAPPPPPPPPPPAPAGTRPRGFAPQPTASGTTTVPLGGAGMPAFTQGMPGGGDPDWLTERLARDAALHERPAWNGAWSRRLASWGVGGVLLALLAGAGFWLYQESRVEGALVVVANESPAPVVARAAPLAVAPARPLAEAPAAPAAPDAPPVSAAAAVGATAAPSTAAGAGEPQAPVFADRGVTAVAADGAAPSSPVRKSSHPARTRREGRAEAKAEARGGQPSARQRHEELLMQCRAHGYAERQCLENGCEMTRYGFACKG